MTLSIGALPRYPGKNLNGLSPCEERQAGTSSVADWALGALSSVALSSQPTMESIPCNQAPKSMVGKQNLLVFIREMGEMEQVIQTL
jgi:hypothetical protein